MTQGGDACPALQATDNAYQCGDGFVCGISQENVKSANLTCGNLLGFWSTDQLCAESPVAYDSVLNCNAQSGGFTKSQWLGCSGPGSCYSTGAGSNCCGCPYWADSGASSCPYASKKGIPGGNNLCKWYGS